MKKLKILLGDPRHYTVGAHSSFVPIGIGYIGTFLKKEIKNAVIELKLEVDPEKIFSSVDEWKPDVIGLSNYVWNAELSNLICEYAKKINPNTLCILGGPEFPAGTGNRKIQNTDKEPTYDKCLTYLLDRPSVDYFAYTDGEVAFVEIVNEFINHGCSVKLMKQKDNAVKGCAAISKDKSKLLVGEYLFRIGMKGSVKSEGRDVVPSPYTSGLLDQFLDGTFQPAFETARGCPFLCTFCDQGIDESKITAFSTKRLAEEMDYVGEKISKIKKGIKTIYIFDSNWGLFQKDIDLADHIAKVMDKYDWPKFIYATTPKSKKENILKIDDKLKNRVGVGLAMQSMNTDVLKNIKRKNYETWQHIEHIKAIQKRGKTANTELIIPLPGETKETYFDAIKFLMDNGVMTNTYTLMMLCGAELGRDEAIKKYQMESKFRILPKQFGEYRDSKVFEVEQVCVSTDTMDFKSYLVCRNYSFVLKVLSQQIFSPIQKLAKKFGLSWYEITRKVASTLDDENFKGKFKELYDGFCNESYTELFDTKENAINFYREPENYKSLMQGDIGENLSEKYVGQAFLYYDSIVTTLFYVIRDILSQNYNEESNLILDSAEKWLKNLYMIDEIFDESKATQKYHQYELKIDFDFPNWLLESHLPFDKFKNKCVYKMNYDIEKIEFARNTKKSIDKKFNQLRSIARFIRGQMSDGTNIFEKQFQKIA